VQSVGLGTATITATQVVIGLEPLQLLLHLPGGHLRQSLTAHHSAQHSLTQRPRDGNICLHSTSWHRLTGWHPPVDRSLYSR